MVSSVCGSFFEDFHDRRILLRVVRARSQFAPLMAMQQTVDVVDGYLLPELFLQRGSKLFGGQQVAAFGLRQMLGEEGAIFVQRHQPPSPSAPAFAVQASGAKRVVLGNPLPNRLR
jgi:hypothetical protein